MQHFSVTDAGHDVCVGRVQESLQLLTSKITDQDLIGLLYWDGMDPLRLVEAGRYSVLEVTEEGVDCRETGIASSCRVAAFLLQMRQESQDQWRIKPLDLDLRRL